VKTRFRIISLISAPALYLTLFFLLPMGLMVVFSFRGGTSGEARDIFTIDNYSKLLANVALMRLLWRSFVIAMIVALVSVALAYPIAYFLAFRAGIQRVTFLTLILIPTWTSYLLRVFAWKLILGSSGLLNSFLLFIGTIEETSPILIYSRGAVIVTLLYVWFPFVALPIFAALERIDKNLLEAASDLGCKPWETFIRVTFPLSFPGVVAGFFFALIPTVGEYVTPLLVGGARGSMYGNLIQGQFMRALNWPMGSAQSFTMLAAVLLLLFVLTRIWSISDLLEL
jgi:spermidine/putrescine transport system permease protein